MTLTRDIYRSSDRWREEEETTFKVITATLASGRDRA